MALAALTLSAWQTLASLVYYNILCLPFETQYYHKKGSIFSDTEVPQQLIDVDPVKRKPPSCCVFF